jgi:hypothetical protein
MAASAHGDADIAVVGSGFGSGEMAVSAELGKATGAGKQPLQISVTLASLAFSRFHHSGLVKRGSGPSSWGGAERTATVPGPL